MEAVVKYVILIYGNPESRRVWQESLEGSRAEGLQRYAALNEELAASGELIVSEALADPSHTMHVTVRGGRTLTGDGPFAEVKELLAGFYLVECETIDRAAEIAARVPEAVAGRLEVRPVMTYSGLD
jgi:hypothetical protein